MPWPPGRVPQSPIKRHRRSNLECGRRDLRKLSLFRGCGGLFNFEISSVVPIWPQTGLIFNEAYIQDHSKPLSGPAPTSSESLQPVLWDELAFPLG